MTSSMCVSQIWQQEIVAQREKLRRFDALQVQEALGDRAGFSFGHSGRGSLSVKFKTSQKSVTTRNL